MGNQEFGRRHRIGLATLTLGLMCFVTTPSAEGSTIRTKSKQLPLYYSTSGTIGTPGGTSVEFVDFLGVGSPLGSSGPSGVFYMPGTFSLGAFQTRGLPAGQQRVFDDVPFSITLNLFGEPFGGAVVSRIRVDGMLDGELSNAPGLGLLASIRSVQQVGTPLGVAPFRLEDLRILAPQFILPAGPTPTSTTPLFAYVSTQVPEPSALVTLGIGASWFLLLRARRRQTWASRNASS